MDKERLEELKKLCEDATPGPWEVHDSCSWRRIGTPGRDGNILCPENHPVDHHPDLRCDEDDLAFIAASRTALPELIAEVEFLTRVARDAERLMKSHFHYYIANPGGQFMRGDGAGGDDEITEPTASEKEIYDVLAACRR
jgi:hypothetical protein